MTWGPNNRGISSLWGAGAAETAGPPNRGTGGAWRGVSVGPSIFGPTRPGVLPWMKTSAPLRGAAPRRGGLKSWRGNITVLDLLEGTVRDSTRALLWIHVETAEHAAGGHVRIPSSFMELRVPFLRLLACYAPTLGPRRHGAVPSSAPRRRCRRSSSPAARRTCAPSLSRPLPESAR